MGSSSEDQAAVMALASKLHLEAQRRKRPVRRLLAAISSGLQTFLKQTFVNMPQVSGTRGHNSCIFEPEPPMTLAAAPAIASAELPPSESAPAPACVRLGPKRMIPSTTNLLPPLSQRARVEPLSTGAPSPASAEVAERPMAAPRASIRLPRSGRLNRVVPISHTEV